MGKGSGPVRATGRGGKVGDEESRTTDLRGEMGRRDEGGMGRSEEGGMGRREEGGE